MFKMYRDRPLNPAGLGNFTTTGGVKKKAKYRWFWRKKKPNIPDDEFSPLYPLVEALDEADDSIYEERTSALMNTEMCMGYFAFNHIVGNGDSYGWSWPHNMITYFPPDAPCEFYLYDMDGSFGANTSSDMFTGGDSIANRMENLPAYRRIIWRHVKNAVNGPFDAARSDVRLDEWYAAFLDEGVTPAPTSPSAWKTWIAARRNYLQGQLSAVDVALAITLNSGADFSTADRIVTLAGTAPVDVADLRLNGQVTSADFSSVTDWSFDVVLEPGDNVLTVDGLLNNGAAATNTPQSITITITYTGSAVSPAGKLVINEIMYNALDSYGDFVELHNISGDRLHLGGLRLNGLDVTFEQGEFIDPNGYVVVAENTPGYQQTYGNAEVLAGEYAGSLDNGGETISLLMPDGTNWVVLDSVRYDDNAPWPTDADGLGPSLQLIDASQDNARVANWQAASVTNAVLYTPGAANSVAATLPPFPEVWINELMVDNELVQDGDEDYDPWLELFNAETGMVDLSSGYYLTDTYTNLTRWAFPSGWTMGSGGYQVVWADGETDETTVSELHAGIALTSPSGMVALAWHNGTEPVVLDYIGYDSIPTNTSYGFYPDGLGEGYDRQVFHHATPGSENNPTSVVVKVRINEWMARNSSTIADPADGQFEDWFELYNAGDATANLAGYRLTDKLSIPDKFTVPLGVLLGVGEHMLVWADGELDQNGSGVELHVNFGLSGDGEAIGLFAPDGTAMDTVTFSTQITDIAEGRWPDGSNAVWQMAVPTPRESNVLFVLETVAVPETNTVDLSWNAVSRTGVPAVQHGKSAQQLAAPCRGVHSDQRGDLADRDE